MANLRSATAYQYIADTLRRRILAEDFGPGDRLPPERELCEQFSASRITVRRSLNILADESLIERRQGDGTYVSPTPSRRIPLLSTDVSGSLSAHAPDLGRTMESRAWQQAHGEVAASLQTYPGAVVLFARRFNLLDDSPVAYDEIYLPEQVADNLSDTDLAQLRFLERWQKVQRIRISHLLQSIEAIPAGKDQVKFLGVKRGVPLLKEIDVIFLSIGTPCGLFISYFRHDLFRLNATIRLSLSNDSREGTT
jgi:DNA-binding GntR family transcriptional regulator